MSLRHSTESVSHRTPKLVILIPNAGNKVDIALYDSSVYRVNWRKGDVSVLKNCFKFFFYNLIFDYREEMINEMN